MIADNDQKNDQRPSALYLTLNLRTSKEIQRLTSAEKVQFGRLARKNRYPDVLPYEINRVLLSPTQSPNSDYINASYLSLDDKNWDAYKYIATQAPRETTICDFWRMCWEQSVGSIVMLVEVGQKCDQYWSENDALDLSRGLQVIHLPTRSVDDWLNIRTFKLVWNQEARLLTHYSMHAWPDQGIPDMGKFLKFYKSLKAKNFRGSTSVVHCSAGVGRIGTFCVIDQAIHLLENGLVDDEKDMIVDIILRFRDQRGRIVQASEQCSFIYQALHHYCSNP